MTEEDLAKRQEMMKAYDSLPRHLRDVYKESPGTKEREEAIKKHIIALKHEQSLKEHQND